eukprot:6609852-Prymnesium_polylepis.1
MNAMWFLLPLVRDECDVVLWQLTSARARSASFPRSQTQMPYASVGGVVAQRHARSEAVWSAACAR